MKFTEHNSNAWAYTFEFWVKGGHIWVEYNNSKPCLLKDLLRSKFYPEVKNLLEDLANYIVYNQHEFTKLTVDDSKSWDKILIEFIQTYFYVNNRKLDVIIRSNGQINLNLEESFVKPYISIYESIKKKYVIRNSRKVLKYYTDNPNKKIVSSGGKRKEVTKTAGEKRARKMGSKKATRKKKGHQGVISKKRARSMKKVR